MKQAYFRGLLLGLIVTLGSASLVQAGHLVTFARGQSIVVQSFEKRGTWYYFILDGGGEMGVPVAQVTQIEDYEIPPAPAAMPGPGAPAPAAQVSAVPGSAPAEGGGTSQANSAGAQPQAAAPSDGGADPNVLSHGNDWRFRARMSGGPAMQQGGGIRKPAGMAQPGMGRAQGASAIPNPYNRRPPGAQAAQPGNPSQ